MQKKILLVDDEPKIIILLQDYLEREHYQVITAHNGKDALACFYEQGSQIDLIVLDVMMPDVDGWTVCREIRKESEIPIIMLTARSEDYDEVHGFEIGADDYVTKPVKPAALMARIQTRLKKSPGNPIDKNLAIGNLILNRESHMVMLSGEILSLSPKEFELLWLLSEKQGKVLSRELLLNQIWGYEYFGGLRTVDTHINRLRIKLLEEGKRITTVRGYGYRIE